jgi:sulfur carrier protein
MQIILNGTPREVPDNLSAAELIGSLGLGDRRLAVEINQEIIPRSAFETHWLCAGDRVEIVHAIGGGAGRQAPRRAAAPASTCNPR